MVKVKVVSGDGLICTEASIFFDDHAGMPEFNYYYYFFLFYFFAII